MNMKLAYLGPVTEWYEPGMLLRGAFQNFLESIQGERVVKGKVVSTCRMIPIDPDTPREKISRLYFESPDNAEVYYIPGGITVIYQIGMRYQKKEGALDEWEKRTMVRVDIGGEEQAVINLERRIQEEAKKYKVEENTR